MRLQNVIAFCPTVMQILTSSEKKSLSGFSGVDGVDALLLSSPRSSSSMSSSEIGSVPSESERLKKPSEVTRC